MAFLLQSRASSQLAHTAQVFAPGLQPMSMFNASTQNMDVGRNGGAFTMTATPPVFNRANFCGRAAFLDTTPRSLSKTIPLISDWPIIIGGCFSRTAALGSCVVAALSFASLSTSPYFAMAFDGSGQYRPEIRAAGGASVITLSVPTSVGINVPMVYVFASFSRTEHYLYMNGVESTFSTDTGAWGADSLDTFHVNGKKLNAVSSTAVFHMNSAWYMTRTLSRSRMRQLSLDPWQIYRAP